MHVWWMGASFPMLERQAANKTARRLVCLHVISLWWMLCTGAVASTCRTPWKRGCPPHGVQPTLLHPTPTPQQVQCQLAAC